MNRGTLLSVAIVLSAICLSFTGCTPEQRQQSQRNTEAKYKKGFVAVYFWDTDCHACRIQERDLATAKKAVSFKLVKVQPDNATIEKYDLNYFPTIIMFKDGLEVKRFSGNADSEQIIQAVGNYSK